MKRTLLIFLLTVKVVWSVEIPFTRGVNLTNWFQTSSPQQIQFTKFTKQDLINIKSLGCDVIRLPINLHFMTNGEPDYTIDQLFLYFLDQVVGWAEELEIHLILDNHTFDPAESTYPDIGDILVPVWTQMAERYKDRSNYLYYEVLNEPHGIADATWNEIQQRVVETIRAVDSTHTIIIGPAGWNGYNNLTNMPEYADTNLIYTFHFYDPFVFTHQGASWTNPSMVPLTGVPFPYDATRMPECPAELVDTWIQGNLTSYPNNGTVEHVKDLIDIAAKFKTDRNVPLFCGEFGVYIPNSDNEDRVYWYQVVRSYLEEKGIAWTIWDYTGGFGLFESGTSELFDYDLNIPLLEALGLNAPPQQEFILKPDSTGFDLYMDYIGLNILESSWTADGIIDYYSETDPVSGEYCIYWTEVERYNHIGFNFKPIKDLSLLVNEGYVFDFWVRGDSPGASFDIRFIDTKTEDPEDHPWRMRKTINETIVTWNNEWNHLQIPLSDFTEQGSWDNDQWFNPEGDFDWAAVDIFQFVSEHHDLTGIKFWLDDIRVIDPEAVGVHTEKEIPGTFKLYQSYPNPFNPITFIRYQLPVHNHVEIVVYNITGQKIRTLVNEEQSAGYYRAIWDAKSESGEQVSSGIYIYQIIAGDFVLVKRMVLMR